LLNSNVARFSMSSSHQWSAGNGANRYGNQGSSTNQITDRTKGMDFNNYQSTGQLGSPVGALKDRIEHLKDFFGHPNKNMDEMQRAYDESHRYGDIEYEDYPEAYKAFEGHNGFLSRVLMEKIKASENWQMTRMAPWVYSDASTWKWSEARFHKHIMDRSPEESVPRMTTHTYRSGQASMVRYGICMMLELNFLSTPQGQQTYLLTIEQLRIAAVETASHGAVINVLEHVPFEDWNDKYVNQNQRSKNDVDLLMKEECSQFAAVHKSKDAYATLRDNLRNQIINRCGESPDLGILPQGMVKFTKESLDDGRHFLDGGKSGSGVPLLSASVVESRGFSYGEHSVAVDPFFRDTTIGGFGTLSDFYARGKIEDYVTAHMDCRIYDESKDRFETIRYRDLYKQAGLWQFKQPGAPLDKHIGKGYWYDWKCYTYGQALRKDNNIQRTVEKLLLIKDESLRNEFLSTLRLLPENDVRLNTSGQGYPQNGTFEPTLFDQMSSTSFGWDTTYAKSYTMAEQERIEKQKKRGFSSLVDADQEKEIREYDEYRRQQQHVGSGVKRTNLGTPSADDFFNDDLMEDAPAGALQRPRVTPAGNRAFFYTPSSGLTARRYKTVPSTHFDDQCDRANSGVCLPSDVLLEIIKATQKVTLTGADKLDATTVTHAGTTHKVSAVTAKVFEYASKLANLSYATDEQKVCILEQLLRIVRNEASLTSSIVGGQSDAAFLARVISNLAPFLAKVEVPMVLGSIHSEHTPIEAAFIQDKDFNFATVSGDIADKGRWKPDASCDDDGQVGLLFHPKAPALALPHDAVAATLAQSHLVLFKTATHAVSEIKGIKQSRADALAWSIALSLLDNTKFDKVVLQAQVRLLAEPKFLARLNRASAQTVGFGVLATQLHLEKSIKAIDVYLRAILARITAGFTIASSAPPAAASPDETLLAELKTKVDADLKDFTGDLRTAFTTVNQKGYAVTYKADAGTGGGDALDRVAKEQVKELIEAILPALLSTGNATDKRRAEICAMPAVVSVAVQLAKATLKPLSRTDWAALGDTGLLAAITSGWNASRALYPETLRQLVNDVDSTLFGTVASGLFNRSSQYGIPKNPKAPSSVSVAAVDKPGQAFAWTRATLLNLLDRASVSCGYYYRFCVDHDIPVPFFLRYWRPSKTYSMGVMLQMISGRNGAAKTFHKNANFMIAQNAAQKMMFGHLTVYMTTVVQATDKIAMAKNVFCRRYIGGNSTEVWEPHTGRHQEAFRTGNLDCASMFITLGLMNKCTPYAQWLSISGVMPPSLNVDQAVAKGVWYPGCKAVSNYWMLRADGGDGMIPITRSQYSTAPNASERRFNVVCMQEAQIDIYDASNPNKRIAIQDCGHWGSWVHDGCGKVRAGQKMHLDPPSYLDTNVYTLR
jgi:hypothetical protein